MRRNLKTPTRKFTADSQNLASLAQSLAQSGSRLERRHWERRLDLSLQKMLGQHQQQAIDSALDHLFHTDLTLLKYDLLGGRKSPALMQKQLLLFEVLNFE